MRGGAGGGGEEDADLEAPSFLNLVTPTPFPLPAAGTGDWGNRLPFRIGLLLIGVLALALGNPAWAQQEGRLIRYDQVRSQGLQPRNLTIWLPPGYDGSDRRYPVLYMQDGQNALDQATSGPKGEWGVDEALTAMSETGRARPAIVVGVWSTTQRARDYMPREVFDRLPEPYRSELRKMHGGPPLSDAYVRFLADELKPWVDASFRTLTGPEDTFVMGSSMGALISLYAALERPDVFGTGVGVSTHWPLFGSWPPKPRPDAETSAVMATWRGWLEQALPPPGRVRLYSDNGTGTIDMLYPAHQAAVDALVRAKGYRPGCDWLSLGFEGAEHDEPAWRARLDKPLGFVLGPRPAECNSKGETSR